MEAATPLNLAQVRFIGDRMVVDGLQVTDPCALRLAHEADDPVGMVLDAIEIGARILERERTGADVEVVKTEFDALRHSIDERTKGLADRMDAKFMEVLGAENSDLARTMARHFGDESAEAVQHRLRTVFGEIAQQMREDLRRQLFSESDDNPLAKFHRQQMVVAEARDKRQSEDMKTLHQELSELRVQLERERGEKEKLEEVALERERGTAKGRTYEEAVFEAIAAIASARGDDCDAVGDVAGDGGKKGDVVVGVDACAGPPRARLVFEAKDRQLSKPAALSELDSALEVRSADYAVLVVPSEEELPARTFPLHEFNANKVFCVFDPEDGSTLSLEVGYSLARARALMAGGDSTGIDSGALRVEVERALQEMRQLSQVKRQLTTVTSGIKGAQDLLDATSASVRAHLEQIEGLLAVAIEAEAEGC